MNKVIFLVLLSVGFSHLFSDYLLHRKDLRHFLAPRSDLQTFAIDFRPYEYIVYYKNGSSILVSTGPRSIQDISELGFFARRLKYVSGIGSGKVSDFVYLERLRTAIYCKDDISYIEFYEKYSPQKSDKVFCSNQ